MSSLRLHVERRGAGAPIVFAHGFAGSARNWRGQLRALEASARVIAFDARGHARSDAPDDAASYVPARFVDDLAGLIEAEAGGPAVVVGLSMGTGVALRLAVARPELVRGLALLSHPTPASAPGQLEWALEFATALERDGLEVAGERYAWGERARFDPKGAALIRAGFLEHRPRALAHVLRELIALQPAPGEISGELRAISAPAVVVAGSDDARSLEPSRDLAAILRDAELVVLEGAGHVVNLSRPREVEAAIERLVERASRA
ncbi:MAG: alpha/beta fold hydrolase [Polyangiaceae bacterium]|nr:alpha/beta fold hydrolase [Polyangiaceae bacterium]